MEVKQIIYIVAFALILRIVVRLVIRYRKEQNQKPNDESDTSQV